MNPSSKYIGALGALALSAALAQPVAAQTTLNADMTVDNAFTAVLSTGTFDEGTLIGSGSDWTVVDSFSGSLTPGVTNYLFISANNVGGPAMFLGQFAIDAPDAFRFANGTESLLSNTTDWLVGLTNVPDVAPVSLGANDDVSPNPTWGYLAGIDTTAEFIWHPDGDTATPVFFVTAIEPLTDVAITDIRDIPDPVLAGSGEGNFTAEIDVSNVGVGVASGVQVTVGITGADDLTAVLPLPPGFDGSVWTVGDLAAGETKTLSVTFTVGLNQTSGTDVITWDAAVTAVDQVDLDASNDSAQESTSVNSASDLTTSFATSIAFTNGFDGSVTATLTCNAGLPLTNSFDISEGSPVTFTMTELPFTTPGTTCEITITDPGDGYSASGDANGDVAASCVFDTSNFAVDGMNTCEFTAEPNVSEFNVAIEFMGVDDPSIEQDWVLDVVCSPASADTGPTFGTVSLNTSGTGSADIVRQFYADPANGTDCTATVSGLASAIEQDGPCTVEDIAVGDDTAACTITATVFFEGIPTLSQYGLAIMALLMLGVGFIGFRRFV